MSRDIPTIADYAHWNEDAPRVWWEENRYDMEHPSEPDEDFDPYRQDYDPEEEDEDYG